MVVLSLLLMVSFFIMHILLSTCAFYMELYSILNILFIGAKSHCIISLIFVFSLFH